MAVPWLFLVIGISILQGSVSFSPLPATLDKEWTEFVERLDDIDYRLPTTTAPDHYELSLTPYFDIAPSVDREFTFDGSVAIRIHANEENVREIVMHCNDMTISSARVETTVGPVRDIIISEERVCESSTNFLRLRTSEALELDQSYIVRFEFRGNINRGMRGFYRSFYRDSTGRRWMGTTQFQPGHARQAFPCYDEPGFKAYFDITIIRPLDFSPTISNMPIKESIYITETNRIAETFFTTPLTSTYLLAFIVSHYDKIASNNDIIRPFDIYARDNAQGKGDWALEIGERLLAEMEHFTNFSYYNMQEYLYMKQAAIPDFSAGAMENWGLLTYREALILYDALNSNHFYKQRVANIVSHEITHMWFGNLVTCAWWDNLWLNEAFARFYQYFLTDSVRPDLGYPTRFITEQLHLAMFDDSVDSAHPLTDPSVSDASSVSNHFSTITYARGACILRMTQYLLGVETYQKGLQSYLHERQFNVAEPHHLFDALDRVAAEDGALEGYGGITIDQYFRTWSEKAGHPLLTVNVDHRTGLMTVSQARWERNSGTSNNPSIWHIPITWTRGGNPDFANLRPSQFISAQVTVINRGTVGHEWVIFNKQETGFYRVNYDDTTWALITRALRSGERIQIHEYNRAQIVNDVFSLARAGVLRYEKAFNILSFLEYEYQYAPWLAAIDGFAFVRRRLAHDRLNLEKLHERIAELSQAVVARLGYAEVDGESFMDGLLRMYVMEFLCNVEHEGCIAAGKENFENWKNGQFLPANLRPWVYCVGLREGTAADFDIFWDRYLQEDLASEQVVMLTAAGCTSDEASLHKFLSAMVADTDDVRPQDFATAYNNAVTGNEVNTLRVFNWIRTNTQAISNAFDGLQTPLNAIAGRLLTEPDMIMFEAWLDNNRDIIDESTYDNVRSNVNTARANLRWSEERVGEMGQYFEQGYVEEEIDNIDVEINYRLPVTTEPSHYEVTLTPYFDVAPSEDRQFTFDGSVAITIHANVEGVTEIVMHCNDMTIISARVETTVGEVRDIIVPGARVCNSPTDFLRLHTYELLQTSQTYIVKLEFRGNINSGMRGFYRSFYNDNAGRRWMGTTQFQPVHARQAFPCYDEPGFKAYFDITIIRPEDFSPTISNMPIKDTVYVTETNRVAETFFTTPLTSTYLLAFIVSHYDKIASNNDDVRPFDIYARNNAVGKGDWALEIGELLLEEMERFTNFSYYDMQEHLDMKQAAIPDFSAGAMENWGLLTYREALILYDTLNSNHFYKQRVANIVSHEITHMWFGNLVTCAWWDNLWLNEGFARFYQYYLTDAVSPDLGYSTRFMTEQLQVAMFSDSIDSAHPLTDPSVSSPSSVSNHFSTITYAKGACILRMTQYLLGKDTYQKGLQTYLHERQFNVAEPHHLFDALDRAAAEDGVLEGYGGITIDQYFRTWSEKAGHPLLTVDVDHRTGLITVVQRRWERNSGTSNYPSLWDIPITWTRGGDPDFEDLKPSQFITAEVTVISRGTVGHEWVIFNKQETGFYRVNYDATTWALITRALRSAERNMIHEYNRAQIVNDVFSLARAGVLRYERAYNILSFLEFEDQYAPWLAAIDGFAFVRRRLAHDSVNLEKLHERITELSQAVVARLGYAEVDDESFMDGLFRMYLMEFLCNVKHEGCIAAGKENFENWKNGQFLPANLRPWVYCVGLREGTAADFDIFWDRYLQEDLASEQVVMLTAAGCTSDEPSLHKFLSAVVADTDDVRPQDLSTAYNNAVSGNELNTLRVFNWIRDNTDAVINAFGGLQTPLNTIAGRLLTEPDMIMFESWLDENRDIIDDSTYNNVKSNVDTARANLRWSDERVGEMGQYFEQGYIEEEIDNIDVEINYRLPVTTEPSHYEVTLTPYFDVAPSEDRQFTFDGSVAITIHANVEGVTEIVMHCNDMTISSARVETTVGEVRDIIVPGARVCNSPTDFLRLQTSEELEISQTYIVKLEFRGNINSGMRGFYRSFYNDNTGRRWMGTTQFQPVHARQAFPCYDEPGFKAYFDITIIRPEDFSETISNMPIKNTVYITETGRVAETFYTTPLTSTYLLAFIVSHYDKIASNNDIERPFDIYARDNAVGKGDWALEIGELLLKEMERFTDISYYDMQEHLDMKQAAIPDFSAGAMENWGLLTYREALILFDDLNSNHFYKQRVANIVSHEITHMWFGNLVTCAWWDNLWLNEGFARFYQYFLTDAVRPDLGYSSRFITEQLQVAMFSDSIDSAHALTNPAVASPSSVSNHFSTITYAKGACILRMTQYLLGNDTYQKGLQTYLHERQFNVAEPHHLFDALDRAAAEDGALEGYGGITIDRYFRTWSEKAGHPLLTVTVNHRTGQIIVVQARWERNSGTSNQPSRWDIPITWTRENDPDFEDLKPSQFITAQATVIDRRSTGLEWVIFNKQESGFYRVNYDPTTWALITRALRGEERTVIHEYNRAQIVNDAFTLARAGVLRYERAYNILTFLEYEDQYAPWLAAIDGFAFVRRRLAHDSDNLEKLHERIAELSQAVVGRLGYAEVDGESFMDGLLRMYIMEFLCNVGHEGCIAAGKDYFESWKNGQFLPANMRPWVYCVGLREGTAADFDIFWDRYLQEDLASEQVVMLTAAGCTSDEPSLHKFLSAVVADTDDVRPQDLSTAYNNAVSGNEFNTLRVFNWIRDNTDAVINAYGSLQTPLNGIAGRLLFEPDMVMFQNWLDDNRDIISSSTYNSVMSNVNSARANLRWSDERVVEMTQYFEHGYVEDDIDDITDSSEESEEDTDPTTTPEPEESEEDENGDGSANIATISFITMTIILAINYVL